MKDNGFTLIEVIVSIAILGILATTFIPILSNQYISILGTGKKSEATYRAVDEVEKKIIEKDYLEELSEEQIEPLLIEFSSLKKIPINVNYIEVDTSKIQGYSNKEESKITVGVPKL